MKYLGVDFGLKRVGLATSEGNFASPFKTIEVKGIVDASLKVIALCKNEQFAKVIVGTPEGKMGKNVLGFVKKLKKRGIDVKTFDETLSSRRALENMIEVGVPKEKRRVNDDQAAAIILQDYLDSKQ